MPNNIMRTAPLFALIILFAALFTQKATASDSEINWVAIDRGGIAQDEEEVYFKDDLWEDYTQEKAIQTLNYFPKILRSPAYKSVMRQLLLHPANDMDGDVDSPAFLAKRIEMLVQYGLFDDARLLLQSVGDAASKDFDLAIMGIALTMSSGELTAACLDIKTLSGQFRDMPAWRELSHYCTARFGERQTLSPSDLNFEKFPLLEKTLSGNLTSLPQQASVIETMVAHADERIGDDFYNKNARTIGQMSDLFIKLALDNQYNERTTYQCYAIEAANRGLLTSDKLAELYQAAEFDESMLNGQQSAVSMHPCDVPAFFYQRLQITDTPELDIAVLLDSAQAISPHAMAPFTPYIKDFYELDQDFGWTASTILALNGMNIDENTLNQPIADILNNESLSMRQAETWKETALQTPYFDRNHYDLAKPIYISRINSGDFTKLENHTDKFNYENFFSLTYSGKSLHSGVGINNALSTAMDQDDIPRALVIMLSPLGSYRPNEIHTDAIAVILSSFSKLKLDKEKHILAIEALH